MQKIPKYIIWIFTALVTVFLVWYFSNIVMYIIAAAVFAIIGSPLMNQIGKIHIRKYKIPRWLSALLTLLIMLVVFMGVFLSLIPLVFYKFNELSGIDLTMLSHSIDASLASTQRFMTEKLGMLDNFSITEALLTKLRDLLNFGTINDFLTSAVSAVGNTAIAVFSICFITFFFLKEENLFRKMVLALVPQKYDKNVNHALDSVDVLLKRYFIGILCESAILFTFVTIVLSLFRMSPTDAMFIGLIVGVLNVIPYIGPLIGLCLGIIIGIMSPIGAYTIPTMALIVGGTIIVAQGIDNVLLQPLLYSNSVHAHPLEIFLVILVAGSVGGILGMLLGIPAYNVLRVFAKEFLSNIRVVQQLTRKI